MDERSRRPNVALPDRVFDAVESHVQDTHCEAPEHFVHRVKIYRHEQNADDHKSDSSRQEQGVDWNFQSVRDQVHPPKVLLDRIIVHGNQGENDFRVDQQLNEQANYQL